ncbi:MAG: thermonuclease family protein [Candidatus Omnitrophota bacterium]
MESKKPTSLKVAGIAAIVYGLVVAWLIFGFMSGERGHASYVHFAPLVALYIIGGIEILFVRNWARKLLVWSFPISVFLLLIFCFGSAGITKGLALFALAMFVVCINPLLVGPPVVFLIYFSRKQVKKIFLQQKQNAPTTQKQLPTTEIALIVLVSAGTYLFFSSMHSAVVEHDLCRLRASDFRPAEFPGDYRVIEVIDGKTLKLSNGETVSLAGVMAPMIKLRGEKRMGQDLDQVVRMGRESKRFVEELIKGKKVSLSYEDKKRDDNGYLLTKVYIVGFTKDEIVKLIGRGTVSYECLIDDSMDTSGLSRKEKLQHASFRVDLNNTILSSGYAVTSSDASEEQKSYSQQACEDKIGLWKRNDLESIIYGKK